MAGYAESGPQCSHLQHYGDHGLGTFPNLNGEMVMIDSVPWQFTADGQVKQASSREHLPFVMVTQFQPRYRIIKKSGIKKDELLDVFQHKGSMKNGFVPFRVKGKFETITVRIVGGQKHGESLTEVAENSVEKQYENTQGTIFGIYSPPWSQGMSVAGVHAHFLSEPQVDGKRVGGHVLNWTAPEAVIEWALSGHLHMGFPNDEKFHQLDLTPDAEGIKKSEG